MTTDEIIFRIKTCIKESHIFSENLGNSTSIHRDHLLKSLTDIPTNDIQRGLLELKDLELIQFAADTDIILLTDKYKP